MKENILSCIVHYLRRKENLPASESIEMKFQSKREKADKEFFFKSIQLVKYTKLNTGNALRRTADLAH
jgi:hypothetical protein